MALNSGKILMRRGQEANFDPNKMMPGEWAVSLDSKFVRMCFSPGVCIRMATYEAFEADMEQIRQILAECENIEQAVSLINTEVSQNAEAVIEYTKEAKQYRDEAKQYRDEAFSSTPDGYDSLVGQVNKNTVAINTIVEKAELNIKETAMGDNIHLIDSADGKNVEFALYGKATQDGTPTPQNTVDIEVSGSGGSVEVKSVGKNLLKNTATSQTINGVTFTVNEDKSVTVKGTSSGGSSFILNNKPNLKKGRKYVVSNGIGIGGKPFLTNTVRYSDGTISYDGFTTADVPRSTLLYDDTIETIEDSRLFVANGVTVNNVTVYPMLRLATDTDATYEKYKETLSAIPVTDFAGIKVDSNGNYTDSNGQQWIANEIVKYADGSGEKIQRIGKVVFDGSEEWTKANYVYFLRGYNGRQKGAVICSHFKYGKIGTTSSTQYDLMIDTEVISQIRVMYSAMETIEDFRACLQENNVTVYYELATPIIAPLTAEEIAEIEKLSTFYPVTNISNDSDCGMKVKYIADSKNYIDNQLAIQAKLQEEALLNMLLLMPEEVQASMIENDTNNLLNESEV